MKYFSVEQFNKTNLVKTLMVPKDQARWRIYSHNVEASMEDLRYYDELGKSFSITPSDMIRVPQGHSVNVLVAKKSDAGSGVVRMEIDDNDSRKHRSVFYVQTELGCVDRFGRQLYQIINGELQEASLHLL